MSPPSCRAGSVRPSRCASCRASRPGPRRASCRSVIRAVSGSEVSPLGVAPGSVGPALVEGPGAAIGWPVVLMIAYPPSSPRMATTATAPISSSSRRRSADGSDSPIVVVHVVVARGYPAAARGAGQQRGRVRIALRPGCVFAPGLDSRWWSRRRARGPRSRRRRTGASGPPSNRPGTRRRYIVRIGRSGVLGARVGLDLSV